MENAPTPYMPQTQAATFLGLSPRTLERFRVEGRGPAFLKLGRRVVYSRDDLVRWAEGQRRRSTSDLGDDRREAAASGIRPSARSERGRETLGGGK